MSKANLPFPEAAMQARHVKGLLFYTFPHLSAVGGLTHAFSSRLGGVSEGCVATLNLGLTNPEDQAANVQENLRRFGKVVGFDPTKIVLTKQTHSVNIYRAQAADAGRGISQPLEYDNIDGLITDVPGLPLMTYHADCTPLFFSAPQSRLCGVAHAGWRGTAANMAGRMVEALTAAGASPDELLVGIGPAAGPCHYQVGAEVVRHFANLTDEQGPLYRPDPAAKDKYLLDLWRANRQSLVAAGVPAAQIVIGGLCTICHSDIFFSHRVQGTARGTLAAVIMLQPI